MRRPNLRTLSPLSIRLAFPLSHTKAHSLPWAKDMAAMAMIRDFYQDKTVPLTGCTGFLGKVLLEKLLPDSAKSSSSSDPNKQFEKYQAKSSIPFDPQTLYYKGNAESQPPPDIDQIMHPVKG